MSDSIVLATKSNFMEGKIYSDQSTAFDHMIEEGRFYGRDKKSQTVMIRDQISAFTFDCALILCILIIEFFLI